MKKNLTILCLLTCLAIGVFAAPPRPNIILVMTDDQGWGQTGYNNHPVLKTPNIDAMAANGLRFDRFYAGAPVCSPTRASVLTGRANDRTGVKTYGYALRLQEKTIAQALKAAGYATGHFGKWHLDGYRGAGVPILEDDSHSPGAFGFDQWLSTTNFFDIDPLLGRNGKIEEFSGDSSAVIVEAALDFIHQANTNDQPFFAVIWDGSPHKPYLASEADRASFENLGETDQHLHGELVAFDRSVGLLRQELREMNLAENTLIWYCSDNGGSKGVNPNANGGLRGHKGQLWEGGLRVPGIIEWPAVIKPRVTSYPAITMDIAPTLADILSLPRAAMLDPIDGISLRALFDKEIGPRTRPLPFRARGNGAWIDNDYKLIVDEIDNPSYSLFNLAKDPSESNDLAASKPQILQRLVKAFNQWDATVDLSAKGKDYQEGTVIHDRHYQKHWWFDERYHPYFENWMDRPPYRDFAPEMKKALEDASDTGSGK